MTFTVYDLEYTAWPESQETSWGKENQHREIIAMAAIRVNDGLRETDSFIRYMNPSQDVSDYIVDLTGISRETIKNGESFSDALQSFNAFIDGAPAWSYGNDAVIIGENLALNDCEELLPPTPLQNIKPFINHADPTTTNVNSGALASHYSVDLDGEQHNPVYDARSILAALNQLVHDEQLDAARLHRI